MVDYSKWKDIEISDDEDDTHPNIDTPSLFRWRHKARIERMEEHKKEVEEFEKKKKKVYEKRLEIEQKINTNQNDKELQEALKKLELETEEIKKQEIELKKKEKLMPWNVDTISNEGFAKTVINKKESMPNEENLTDEEREAKMKKFVDENEKKLKEFGMLRRYDDSKRFLMENGDLVCENTANYLVLWAINLEMQEKHNLMEHVAHQTICIQYILELAKQFKVHPRSCVSNFFSRIKTAEQVYQAAFNDELEQLKERVKKRAAEKLQEIQESVEEEERQARLGPGGLDPVEVFESLPDELKKCFELQDIPLLQETISKMDEEEAKYHLKRCIDSGLWVPDGNKQKNKEETTDNNDEKPETSTSADTEPTSS